MKHLKENLERSKFQVIGMGPTYADLQRIARGLVTGQQVLCQTKHKFFFCIDREVSEALILWFAGDKLHQRKMNLTQAEDLLNELEKSKFRLEELN